MFFVVENWRKKKVNNNKKKNSGIVTLTSLSTNVVKHILKCSNEGVAAGKCVIEDGILLFRN